MSNFHASKQLHMIRKQLKEMDKQYRDGDIYNTARDTVIKTNHPTHFGAEGDVSFYFNLIYFITFLNIDVETQFYLNKIVQTDLLLVSFYDDM